MGASERQYLMNRLYDMEQTIAGLHQQVSRLQREVNRDRVTPGLGFFKGSCLRSLFGGWRQNEMVARMVRQNRRVERHAASL